MSRSMHPAGSKVVFFHVMKAAGMTFRGILQKLYGDQFHVVEDPEVDRIAAAFQQFQCLEFHTVPYRGDFQHMTACLVPQRRWDVLQGAQCFTTVREPASQVLSQYFYMVAKRSWIEPAYRLHQIPFPETLEQYLDQPWHFNNQTAFLAGVYQLGVPAALTSTDLDNVKTMISDLDIRVGLMEHFPESLRIFEAVTGCSIGHFENQNENPARPPLESVAPQIHQAILERSSFDVALYEFARQRYLADAARYL